MTDQTKTETPVVASTAAGAPAVAAPAVAEPTTIQVAPPKTPQAVLSDPAFMAKLTEEYAKNGDLTPETYTALAGAGVSKELVSDYVQAKMAAAELEGYRAASVTQKVYEACGGKDAVDAACEWARLNETPAAVEALNAQLRSSDPSVVSTVIMGLQAKARSAGSFAAGSSGGNPTPVFENEGAWQAAMNDPKYAKDAAYRAEVDARMNLSVKLGKISLHNISTR
jgi:hypothetical protein